ncbi:hypothetical protein ABOONEI_2675 [Aciduliprofundum boonei T469]|nr:hypothetical protein ABOONEI_2675 [Aciduliprofundum boonei T469]
MCSLFGFSDFKELKEEFKNVDEGYDEDGYSHMYHRIISFKNLDPRVREKMPIYDTNIKGYLEHINKNREFKVTLKYFQYLAVLFTEIYLDFYFQDPIKFINELTEFGLKKFDKYGRNYHLITFIDDDLRNLAYWMATASGKTLIMHINYLQFLKYNKGPNRIDYENFILITPNAGMSQQHIRELQKSNIPCKYLLDGDNRTSGEYPVVQVVEITKFTGDKKGGGESIDVKSVTSRNIVFADEAHKGTSGDAWRSYREQISKDGFKFEYSATFGQALKKVDPKDELLQTYAKSILFDYSYKYFYSDGYGKDYRIINTKTLTEDLQYRFLLANALSFYEQIEVFESSEDYRKIYNIERPLWVFVGSRVQQNNNRDKAQTMSDILKVVIFLHKFLKDKDWAISNIRRILGGDSGILDPDGNDVFVRTYPETKYPYLRSQEINAEEIYENMLKKIFKTRVSGALYMADINADGEIGLKVGPFGRYFGVINIGDKAGFLKYIRGEREDIVVEKDTTTSSLFEGLEKSDVDILIGARKFVEGWNSWRVSTMGLIHMGKTEGPLIIQLFGRGVRLKGYNKLLKRSTAITEVKHPKYIPVLETLNVFGIQANYMELFREYLEKEDVPTKPPKEFEVPTKIHKILLEGNHDLQIPRVREGLEFRESKFIRLYRDNSLSKVVIDLRPRASVLVSKEEGEIKAQTQVEDLHIEQPFLDLLNWDYIYGEILEYKRGRGWYNLLITKESLQKILYPSIENGSKEYVYDLHLPDPSKVKPSKLRDVPYLEDLAILILKNYITKFYYIQRMRWEKRNLTYYKLTPGDKNFFEKYIIKIPEKELSNFEYLVNLLEEENYEPLYGPYDKGLKNVYIDVHLYQPLLEDNSKVTIIPKGLNEGERDFIEKLRNYLKNKQECLENKNIKVYVLRNRTRGKGVGFFEANGFYPDFIVWIKKEDVQHILFVEPHGLGHFSEKDIKKIELYKKIKDIENSLKNRTGKNVTLDSYVISRTEYKDIKHYFNGESKKELKKKHLLFKEDPGYVYEIMDDYLECQ